SAIVFESFTSGSMACAAGPRPESGNAAAHAPALPRDARRQPHPGVAEAFMDRGAGTLRRARRFARNRSDAQLARRDGRCEESEIDASNVRSIAGTHLPVTLEQNLDAKRRL